MGALRGFSMIMDCRVFLEDLNYICKGASIDWEDFADSRILITGGTGLIGSIIINALLYANRELKLNLQVVALVRNLKKAECLFGKYLKSQMPLYLVKGSIENIPLIEGKIDYVIHCACPTASDFFINKPVETIKTSVIGTINVLDFAKEKNAKGVVYLSSMEAYGEVGEEKPLSEDDFGYLNPTVIRNCYPEGKRMCESLCAAYAKEYGLRVMGIRLAQTFGPGVLLSDNRVFAMMARCAINMNDIILHTKGESKHSYLYTAEAASAIFIILSRGKSGEIYNAANPKTYCSIYEMGLVVAEQIACGKIKVRISGDKEKNKYPQTSYLNLNIKKIQKIGWEPYVDLVTMYKRMITTMSVKN